MNISYVDDMRTEDMEQLHDVERTSLILQLDTPSEGIVYSDDQEIIVQGSVNVEGGSLEFVVVEAILDDQQNLPIVIDRDTGQVNTVLHSLPVGEHTLTLRAAMSPDYRSEVTHQFFVTCETVNDFDLPLDHVNWITKGVATKDMRGWIELTGVEENTRGALFWVGSPLNPGNIDVEFSFSSSKCSDPGPCDLNRVSAGGGFAINFWDILPEEIEGLWSVTQGVGNVLSTTLQEEFGVNRRPESFHVVFDTYSNSCTPCETNVLYDGCENQHTDPTHGNHIKILLNGHAVLHDEADENGNYCHLGEMPEVYNNSWGVFPNLDDGEWHHAHLTIIGTHIRLKIDDISVIDFNLPLLSFKGGILSFSAGQEQGFVSNHRIDQLRINGLCQ